MGEAFFIPLDPVRFFAEHDLGPAYGVPASAEAGGLRFESRCLGCGVETAETVVLRGGTRGSDAMEWSQPIPMCARCGRLGGRLEGLRRTLGMASLATALCGAGGCAWALYAFAGWSQIALMAVVVGSAALGTVLVRAAASRWLEPWLMERIAEDGMPLSGYRHVELFYFRDPRMGEGARFLCVRIEDDARATAFGRLNRHAVPSAVWDASFVASGGRPEDVVGRPSDHGGEG